MYTLDHNPTV